MHGCRSFTVIVATSWPSTPVITGFCRVLLSISVCLKLTLGRYNQSKTRNASVWLPIPWIQAFISVSDVSIKATYHSSCRSSHLASMQQGIEHELSNIQDKEYGLRKNHFQTLLSNSSVRHHMHFEEYLINLPTHI